MNYDNIKIISNNPVDKRKNYVVTLDNRFWEKILDEARRNSSSGFSFSQALASLFQRSYSSIMLQGEPWIDVTLRTLSTQFGWYRVRTKKFLEWCEQAGIIEIQNIGKKTFARVVCLQIINVSKTPQIQSDGSSPASTTNSTLPTERAAKAQNTDVSQDYDM